MQTLIPPALFVASIIDSSSVHMKSIQPFKWHCIIIALLSYYTLSDYARRFY